MASLDECFKDLRAQLGQPATLNPAKSDPIFYFVYPAAQMLELKRCLPVWSAALRNEGFNVERISLSDLLWQIIDDSGRYEAWLDLEAGAEVDPRFLATSRFALAQTLWAAPTREGDEREQARSLAEQALSAYAKRGAASDNNRKEVEDWLAKHAD